jgi:hypothetical protein
VLLELAHGSCILIGATEHGHDDSVDSDENGEGSFRTLFETLARDLPDRSSMIPTSLILPADRTIESSIKIPKALGTAAQDWEHWELSMNLTDSPDDYWYESCHVGDSVCGRFRLRRVLAARKRMVTRIVQAAAKLNLLVDGLFFPQSIWGDVIRRYGPTDGRSKLDCVCLGRRFSHFFRVSGGMVMNMSSVQSPNDGEIQRFVETVATLLSWDSGRGAVSSAKRIILDDSGSERIASALISRLGFHRFDPKRVSKHVHDGIDQPQRFLLPLAALGVI